MTIRGHILATVQFAQNVSHQNKLLQNFPGTAPPPPLFALIYLKTVSVFVASHPQTGRSLAHQSDPDRAEALMLDEWNVLSSKQQHRSLRMGRSAS